MAMSVMATFCPRFFCRRAYAALFLGVDALPVLGVVYPAQGIHIAAGGTVLAQVLVRIVPGHGAAPVKPYRVLAVAIGVDVLGVPALDGCLAGFLPAAACQCQAKSAGVTLGHPGKLGPVPQGVF